jgi:hypothetical protein
MLKIVGRRHFSVAAIFLGHRMEGVRVSDHLRHDKTLKIENYYFTNDFFPSGEATLGAHDVKHLLFFRFLLKQLVDHVLMTSSNIRTFVEAAYQPRHDDVRFTKEFVDNCSVHSCLAVFSGESKRPRQHASWGRNLIVSFLTTS